MLRHIFISVIYDPRILSNTLPLDESLVRAAHQALVRKNKGISDTFLFVFFGDRSVEEVRDAIDRYGFPDADFVVIPSSEIVGDYGPDDCALIGDEISSWLKTTHPASLPHLSMAVYDTLDMWWTGVVSMDTDPCCLIDASSLTEELPSTYKKKAATWLAILMTGMDCLEVEAETVEAKQFALYAAALCEWLHGFEAASGNSYNDFDPISVCNSLDLDAFYLGYIAGQKYPGVTAEELFYTAGIDDYSELRGTFLKELIEEYRSKIQSILSEWFGSESSLFCALYTSIWPRYDESLSDYFCGIANLETADYSDLAQPWQFVTDGWHDSADA